MAKGTFPLEKIKPKRKPKDSIKGLEKKLKNVLYPLIKERDGNHCISCGKRDLEGRDWHCGHFIPAELCNLQYRYDVRNLNSQCGRCNNYLKGNYPAYRKEMLRKYGEKVVKELEDNYKQPLPIDWTSREWLEQQREHFKQVGSLIAEFIYADE